MISIFKIFPFLQDLGAACGSKRPTCMVMIKKHNDYEELYKEIHMDVKDLPQPFLERETCQIRFDESTWYNSAHIYRDSITVTLLLFK